MVRYQGDNEMAAGDEEPPKGVPKRSGDAPIGPNIMWLVIILLATVVFVLLMNLSGK